MKKSDKPQSVTIKSVRHANRKLMSTGIVVKEHRATTGTVTVCFERGSLNLHKVVSKDEMRDAYKVALKGNA